MAPINHVLAQAPWARARLVAFAGNTARFRLFPFDYRITVTADGLVEPALVDGPIDTTITLTAPVAVRFLAGDESAQQEMKVDGNTAFAQEIAYLSRHLRWDFEEDLSKVFGDVVAHRTGEGVRDLNAWLSEAGNNLAENFRDYWVQERPLVASREAVEQFIRDVDQLRDDVERLDKRIDKLIHGK
ncbi:MAG: SCP2 sterol-binding domain-containing protein [Pseudomonadota bacterium]